MRLITLFIIGIAFLIILPAAYFCFSKLLDQTSENRSAGRAAFLFFLVFAVTVTGAGNMYTYFINSEEGIVAQRYVNCLIKNAESGDIDTLEAETGMISYEMEELKTVFESVKAFEVTYPQAMRISESRRYDDAGVKHLYLWLNEAGIVFDVGLKQQKRFWDVCSIALVSAKSQESILSAERFLLIK